MKNCALHFQTSLGDKALSLLVAESMYERMRGLLARPTLAAGEGMLLRSCRMIHTFGMRYPIDVIYLRRDGLVLKVTGALRPRRMDGSLQAHCVIELLAGEARRHGVVSGSVLPIASI